MVQGNGRQIPGRTDPSPDHHAGRARRRRSAPTTTTSKLRIDAGVSSHPQGGSPRVSCSTSVSSGGVGSAVRTSGSGNSSGRLRVVPPARPRHVARRDGDRGRVVANGGRAGRHEAGHHRSPVSAENAAPVGALSVAWQERPRQDRRSARRRAVTSVQVRSRTVSPRNRGGRSPPGPSKLASTAPRDVTRT